MESENRGGLATWLEAQCMVLLSFVVFISAQSIICAKGLYKYNLLQYLVVTKDLSLIASQFSSFTPLHLQPHTFELVHAANCRKNNVTPFSTVTTVHLHLPENIQWHLIDSHRLRKMFLHIRLETKSSAMDYGMPNFIVGNLEIPQVAESIQGMSHWLLANSQADVWVWKL